MSCRVEFSGSNLKIALDLEAQIKALPLAQLEELGEALLDFSQMNDLVVWLDVDYLR